MSIIKTKHNDIIVDDEDYEYLNQFKWYSKKTPYTFYAYRHIYINEKRTNIAMHTEITGYSITDHIDGNGLNNCRSNLRKVTCSQNQMNTSKRLNCTSKYKGVCWSRRLNKWRCQILRFHLGLFDNEIDAARAYDAKAIELFGEYAKTNLKGNKNG